jgi:transcriptional regulator with XRE-family HTH domain
VEATSEIESQIGSRLTAARKRLGWSREALAFHSGLSWSAIAQIESGRRTNVRPSTLAALADALGVTIDFLIGRAVKAPGMFEHDALLYGADEEFAEHAGAFLAEGVACSQATLAVTTPANVELLRKRLGKDASEVKFADARRWYTTPAASLAAYQTFIDKSLGAGRAWVRILGEPIWSGKSADEVNQWTRYESLLNLSLAGLPVTLVCPYDGDTLSPSIVEQACLTHRHTRSKGEVVSNPDYKQPSDFALEP